MYSKVTIANNIELLDQNSKKKIVLTFENTNSDSNKTLKTSFSKSINSEKLGCKALNLINCVDGQYISSYDFGVQISS